MLDARPMGASLFMFAFFLAACSTDTGSGDDAVGGDGVDAGSDSGDDDGDGDDGNADCVPEIVEMPTAAACAAATQTCLDTCEDDACYDTCLAADPDPDACGTCIDDAYVACGNQMGCQADWDALICCYDGCADEESEECATSCAVEGGSYETCLEAYDGPCFEGTAVCFQP
jgi:hypothetical protein